MSEKPGQLQKMETNFSDTEYTMWIFESFIAGDHRELAILISRLLLRNSIRLDFYQE